jgi:alpha-amylase
MWISPVVKNIDGMTGWGEAYHGYWAQDINQLNPHFGTEGELKELSDALHERGMVGFWVFIPSSGKNAEDMNSI